MTPEDTQQQNNMALLKEMSDFKALLAVNNTETANIKASITEIKGDIKDIKTDGVSRREFTDALMVLRREYKEADLLLATQLTKGLEVVRNDISPLKKVMYGLMGTIGLAVIGALLKLIIK